MRSGNKSNLGLNWEFVSFVRHASNNRWHLGHLLQVGNRYRWPRVNNRIFELQEDKKENLKSNFILKVYL